MNLDLPGSAPVAGQKVRRGRRTWITIRSTACLHRQYDGPFFLTGIDLTRRPRDTVVASISIPGSAEQPRFNPVDGLMYLTIPQCGRAGLRYQRRLGRETGRSGGHLHDQQLLGNGNWIDPVTNTMMVGCNNVGGQALVQPRGWDSTGALSAG